MKFLNTIALIITIQITLQAQQKFTFKDSLLVEWNKIDTLKKHISQQTPEYGFYAALVHNSKIISEQKMGYANRETKLLFDKNVIWVWGSISKMFTSIAIHRLIHKGKLKFTDSIIKYIPELGKGVDSLGSMRAIKIHHLLNHNSGINLKPVYDSIRPLFKKRGVPLTSEIVPVLKYASQRFKPGTKYQYSNGGYSLLGLIIERVSTIKFTKYVTKYIFKPLGMKTAHYYPTPKKLNKLHSKVYITSKREVVPFMYNHTQGFQEANGGVKASVEDMLKFMDFLKFRKRKKFLKRYNKVLPQHLLEKYYHDVDLSKASSIMTSQEFARKNYNKYKISGFSLYEVSKPHSKVMGHSGYIAWHSSLFFFNQKHPYGIIVMFNTTSQTMSNETLASRKLYNVFFRFVRQPKVKPKYLKWETKKK